MRNKPVWGAVGWMIFFLWACQATPTAIEDTQAPDIGWSYPQKDQRFSGRDTVRIQAVFSDETALRQGAVHIHDNLLPPASDTVFVYEFAMQGKTHLLDSFFVLQQPQDRNYTIYLTATDQADNATQRIRSFVVRH